MKKIFLPLLLCLLLPCAAWAETLPSLNLASLNDLLAKNKGKVVMLNFFATWCPPCRVEIPELIKTSKAYADKGVVIISLSVDEDSAPVLPFVKKMGMDYPVYLPGGTSPGLIRSAAFRITLFTPRTARWFFPSRAWPTKACSKWLSTSF